MRTWPLLAMTLSALACSGGGTNVRSTAPASAPSVNPVADAARQLVLPPRPESYEAYMALEAPADEGNLDAAWMRVHYLLDLFDSARFGPDAEARALLGTIAGRPSSAMSGPAATQAVAELLLLEIDHLLDLDPHHAKGLAARVLLQYDMQPPTQRSESYQRQLELRRIQKSQPSLEASAAMRRFQYCKQALLDSFDAVGPLRREARAHCLYALYPANPSPYFHERAGRRPPPPRLEGLKATLSELLPKDALGRLRPLLASQRKWAEELPVEELTSPEDALLWLSGAETEALPHSRSATPISDILSLGSDDEERRAYLEQALQLQQDKSLSVQLPATATAAALTAAAERAAGLGADELHLALATTQRIRAPKGDYWHGRHDSEDITVVGALPLSLRFLSKGASREDHVQARALRWDEAIAARGLHLSLTPTQWALHSSGGVLAEWDATSTLPTRALSALLEQVQRAYPEEAALVVVPAPNLPLQSLVDALDATRLRSNGRPLFRHVALHTELPRKRSGRAALATIERRAAAAVRIQPESASSRQAVALRCYQEALNKKKLTGKVRIERSPNGKLRITPKRGPLSTCAERALGGQILDGSVDSAELDFSLAPAKATDASR